MRKSAWVFSVLLLAGVFWVVASSSTFQSCIQKEEGNADNQHFQSSSTEIVEVYRHCIGGFVHDNAEGIIAIFTIILALSTIFLWRASRDLVNIGIDTAERQLRAYISTMVAIIPDIIPDVEFSIGIIIRNDGLTPAHEFSCYGEMKILPHPLPKKIDFSDMKPNFVSRSVIHPRSDVFSWTEKGKFTQAEITQFSSDQAYRLYIYGIAIYDDVFKIGRETRFCSYLNQDSALLSVLQAARTGQPKNPQLRVSFGHGDRHNRAT